MDNMIFRDRRDAGKKLADALSEYKNRPATIVIALPRGGVPVGYEVANSLNLPLDVLPVRKLGVPNHEEIAMGAIADDNIMVLNEEIIHGFSIPPSVITDVSEKERVELKRRNEVYRGNRPLPHVEAHTVILVDDGCATGANIKAAIRYLEKKHAAQIVVAMPVASDSSYETLLEIADKVVCLDIPEHFLGVGGSYRDFSQTSDKEVVELLGKARKFKL